MLHERERLEYISCPCEYAHERTRACVSSCARACQFACVVTRACALAWPRVCVPALVRSKTRLRQLAQAVARVQVGRGEALVAVQRVVVQLHLVHRLDGGLRGSCVRVAPCAERMRLQTAGCSGTRRRAFEHALCACMRQRLRPRPTNAAGPGSSQHAQGQSGLRTWLR